MYAQPSSNEAGVTGFGRDYYASPPRQFQQQQQQHPQHHAFQSQQYSPLPFSQYQQQQQPSYTYTPTMMPSSTYFASSPLAVAASAFGSTLPSSPIPSSDTFQIPDQTYLIDIQLLKDRFRLVGSMIYSLLFHWSIIYAVLFFSQLLTFSIEFKMLLLLDKKFVWYAFGINSLVGILTFLHYFQVQWSNIYSLDQVLNQRQAQLYIRLRTLGYFMAYTFIGMFLSVCYLGLYNADFARSMTCSENEGCINDKYLFILFSSVYLTGSLFVNFRKSFEYRLQFPEVRQPFHGKFRHFYYVFFSKSARHVFHNLLPTYIIYYFMGTTFRIWISSSTQINLEKNLLQTFSQFLSIELFLYVFITCTLSVGSFNVCWEFLLHFLTKKREFPLDVDPVLTDNESIVVLSDGLKARNNECMRNLAFFDLYCMTEQVEKRVEDLFKIRLKGGPFFVWTAVLENCLGAIRDTTNLINNFVAQHQKMEKELQLLQLAEKQKSEVQDKQRRSIPSSLYESNNDYGYTTGINSLTIRRRGYIPVRPLKDSMSSLGSSYSTKRPRLTPVEILLRGSFRTGLGRVMKVLRQNLRAWTWAKFYYRKKLEIQISMMLQDSQVILLSIRSLMNIVNIYLKNDFARAVQQDLGQIIVTLVDFHEALNSLRSIELSSSKTGPTVFPNKNTSDNIIKRNAELNRLNELLNRTVAHSLLEMDYHFNQYYDFMPLSFEHQSKIRNLVNTENSLGTRVAAINASRNINK